MDSLSITGLARPGIPVAPAEPPPANAAEAAEEFEALLIAQMLRSVHEAAEGDDSTQDTMWELASDHLSRALAKAGGLGLARMIRTQLDPPGGTGRDANPAAALDREP